MQPELLARGIALGRVGFGVGMLVAPDQLTRRWIGHDADRIPTQVVVRALGARDLLLGAGALASQGGELQRWLLAAIGADAADLTASLAAGRAIPLSGRIVVVAAAGGAIAGGAAALAGLRRNR